MESLQNMARVLCDPLVITDDRIRTESKLGEREIINGSGQDEEGI